MVKKAVIRLSICGKALTICLSGLVCVSSSLGGPTWIDHLPPGIRSGILWAADHEEGSLADWDQKGFRYAGGGIFNTGRQDAVVTATTDIAHSGRWSSKATITNAVRARNGRRAVRKMRWTNKAWDDGGQFFPNEAYYSTWVYFPHRYNPNKYQPWDPGDGGWWNIFQFKGKDRRGTSRPVWTLNVAHHDRREEMSLYLYSKYNAPSSRRQYLPVSLPVGKWVHVEAYYKSATDRQGRIHVWQDGRLLFHVDNVVTSLGGKSGTDTHPIWGVGNYTDHISGDPSGEGTATVYFDDAIVGTVPTWSVARRAGGLTAEKVSYRPVWRMARWGSAELSIRGLDRSETGGVVRPFLR